MRSIGKNVHTEHIIINKWLANDEWAWWELRIKRWKERTKTEADGCASVRWSCVVVVSVAFGWWQVNCILSLGEWPIMQKLWTLLQAARKSSRRRKKQWEEAVDKWFIGHFSWTLCSLQAFLWLVSAKTEKRIGRHFRSGIKMDGIKKSMSKWSFSRLFTFQL